MQKRETHCRGGRRPAGLSCAAVAAERGHEVTLFESARELGGQFNLAKVIPGKQEFAESVAYYAERLRRLKVDVRLNRAADGQALEGFDEAGSRPGSIRAGRRSGNRSPQGRELR